ncbi:MAG: KH domain-containing protein [Acidobacteria bacterium]|nr:KH domain-containing protein [Acidobacteriota bacterium]
MSRARDVVEVVTRALAARPAEVEVTEAERRGNTVVELRMAPGELGRVIGREGRTATALRTLAAAAGELDGRKVVVDFHDE